jgi:hypothetical protein
MTFLARRTAGAVPIAVLLIILLGLLVICVQGLVGTLSYHDHGWSQSAPSASAPPCGSISSTPIGECWT